MTNFQANCPEKIYFYAPDTSTHNYFSKHRREEITKFGNSLLINWIASTYIELQKVGISCEVIDRMPRQGIVIADRATLDSYPYSYLDSIMLLCAKGDRDFHPSVHFHVVQNTVDTQNPFNSIWNPYFIPHWPQPGLQARDRERGSTVKNVAFMGTIGNLTEEFKSDKWISALKKLDCTWTPVLSPAKWYDYSQIDIIVAVRSFDGNKYPQKPASKLINAWRAGVPIILTPESAFVSLRKSELDFLIINSLEEAIDAVAKLKTNPDLYLSMIDHGLERAREFSGEKITEYWLTFLRDYVFPEYAKWHQSPKASKIILFARRYADFRLRKVFRKLISKDVRKVVQVSNWRRK